MSQKRTLDEPEIQAALDDLYWNGCHYAIKDPVTHEYVIYPIFQDLLKLVSKKTASRLLAEAVKTKLIKKLPEGVQARPREIWLKTPVPPEPVAEADNDDDDELTFAERKRLDRFELAKVGDWYGYYDNEYYHEELVSRDKAEALERIYELQRVPTDTIPFPWSGKPFQSHDRAAA